MGCATTSIVPPASNSAPTVEDIEVLVGVESLSGRVEFYTVRTPANASPEGAIAMIWTVLTSRVPKRRRILERIVLRKRCIKLANLSTITDPALNDLSLRRPIVTSRARDDVLSKALFDPSAIADVDPAAFFSHYSGLIYPANASRVPPRALLIELEVDRHALMGLRIAATLLSIGVGVGLQFAMA